MARLVPAKDSKTGQVVKVGGQIKYRVKYLKRRPDGTFGDYTKTVIGEQAARRKARELALRYEGEAAQLPAAGTETVFDVAEWWLAHYKTSDRKRGKAVEEESYEAARREIIRLVNEHGHKPFTDLTTRDLQRLADKRPKMRFVGTVENEDGEEERRYEDTDELAAAGTRNRMIGVLRAFATDAKLAGYREDNIGTDLKAASDGPRSADSQKVHPPTLDQLRTFAADLDRATTPVRTRWGGTTERARWQQVHDPELWRPSDRLWLFALSGFMFSEARGLLIDDWLRDKHQLVLTGTQKRGADERREYGKTDARLDDRRVPVPGSLESVLERLAAYSRDGHLLTGPDGRVLAYETWRNQMKNTAEATGIDLDTRLLRHHAATLWIEAATRAGRDWRWEVMRFGGWSSTDMVEQVYGHLTDTVVDTARDSMDAILEHL